MFLKIRVDVYWLKLKIRKDVIHPNPGCKQKTGHVIHDRLSAISQIVDSFSLSRCVYNNFICHFITMRPGEVQCCL